MSKVQRAFTLIELLIVIAIIAVLLTILAPALQVAKQHATGAVCLGNQRGLAQAWVIYADENKGLVVNAHTLRDANYEKGVYWVEPPQAEDGTYRGDGPAPHPTLADKQRGIMRGLLYKYTSSLKVYHCPGDRREFSVTEHAFRSYALVGGLNGEPWGDYTAVKKISNIPWPEEKYALVEESDDRGWNMGSWQMDPDIKQLPTAWYWTDPLSIWHNKKSTLGYCDGHSKMIGWKDERTIQFCEGEIGGNQPNNPDIYFMKKGFPYQELR
jgi:prepilin-type N-terminal cleavage/methylation domain-containing protein/prepilin-type processing-associated H-X9-DG protein